jgi:hypothetical protein
MGLAIVVAAAALTLALATSASAATTHGCARAVEGASPHDPFVKLRVRGLTCYDAARMTRRAVYAADPYYTGRYGTHATWRMSGWALSPSDGPGARVLRRFTCTGRNDRRTLERYYSVLRVTCSDFKADALWFSARFPRD